MISISMEKHRICKICNKRFANGKAMGGHMRSHLAKLPIPPKPNPSPNLMPDRTPIEFTSKSISSSSSLSIHSTKHRHMQTYQSINRELSDLDMEDGESEAESPRNPTRRRSKRRRKAVVDVFAPTPHQPAAVEPESVSSVTENFSDEEVAFCLLMLSRDKWPEEDKADEYIGNNDVEEKDEDKTFCVSRRDDNVFSKNKYKCKTCKKRFGSYQALGGHKASHKKIKIHFKRIEEGSSKRDDVAAIWHKRMFKCPFCDKVFESGQALGGHKKVHFSYLGVARNSAKSGGNSLDLNLPAPEEYDSEVSQV